jgi:hypothetical protein
MQTRERMQLMSYLEIQRRQVERRGKRCCRRRATYSAEQTEEMETWKGGKKFESQTLSIRMVCMKL